MAKRVKWVKSQMSNGDLYYTVIIAKTLELEVDCRIDGTFWGNVSVEGCFHRKQFKKLESAKRYCIREALKLHKLVGTQLTELERGQECRQLTKANDYVG